jgi:hypothetical protein
MIATQQSTFTGVGEVVLQLAQQLGGALGIPLARFFGQSPGGLNSPGEFEWNMYSTSINQRQELKMRFGMDKIIRVTAKSKRIKIPDNFGFTFVPIAQLSETQKSEIFQRDAGTIMDLESGGIIRLVAALKELRQLSRVTGRGTNITDEDITDAEGAAPTPREEDDEEGNPGRMDTTDSAKILRLERAWKRLRRGDARTVTHLQWKRPSALGGSVNGTWCNRMQVTSEGMNLTDDPQQVTCAFCKKKMEARGLPSTNDADSGMIDFHGVPVTVETFKGEKRFGRPMPAHYGYINRTGSAEGADEQMDCFVGDEKCDGAFIIDSYDHDRFDEHKVMLGYATAVDALNDFNAAYTNYRIARTVSPMSINGLATWLETGDVKKPFAEAA